MRLIDIENLEYKSLKEGKENCIAAAKTADVDELAALVTDKTKLIIINSPQNPTGSVLTPDELKAIGQLAADKGIWILSDEIYSRILYGHEHDSVLRYGDPDRIVVLDGFSKTYAMTGWRLGWAVAPERLIEAIGKLSLCMLFGAPSFSQSALAAWLEEDLPELAEMKEAYRRRRDLVFQLLAAVPGLNPHRPEAGMFMMVDVRGTGLSAEDFAWRLLEDKGVSVLPTDPFGPSATGHVRLSYGVAEASLADACGRIAEFVEELGQG